MRKICTFLCLGLIMGLWFHPRQCDAAGNPIDLQALLARRVPILLEFGRGWCIPCKYMKPILENIAKAYGPRAIVTTVNMDANRNLVQTFRIRMMPTQVFLLPDGKEFFRNEGTLEPAQIIHIFSKLGLPPPGQAAAQPQRPQPRPPAPGASTPGPRKPW